MHRGKCSFSLNWSKSSRFEPDRFLEVWVLSTSYLKVVSIKCYLPPKLAAATVVHLWYEFIQFLIQGMKIFLALHCAIFWFLFSEATFETDESIAWWMSSSGQCRVSERILVDVVRQRNQTQLLFDSFIKLALKVVRRWYRGWIILANVESSKDFYNVFLPDGWWTSVLFDMLTSALLSQK
jgi:uncharacterized membrane protein YhdT